MSRSGVRKRSGSKGSDDSDNEAKKEVKRINIAVDEELRVEADDRIKKGKEEAERKEKELEEKNKRDKELQEA